MANENEKLGEYELALPPTVFRAHTLSRSVSDVYQGATKYSDAELLGMVERQHGAFGPGIDTSKIGFWRAAISNSSLDSYFTRMAKSSLMNYSADASNPTVSFQNSHNHRELPVGRSIQGQFIESGNAPQGVNSADYFPAVIADFYSYRELQLGTLSVEQFMLGIDSHVIQDVSIGFKEGEGFRYVCNICGLDYWDWDCRHVAGVEYEMSADPNADPADQGEPVLQLCFCWIENARLSEVSAVYDGATTNAMIIKAEREVRAGRMVGDTLQFLERRFRFRADSKLILPGKDREPEAENKKRGQNDNMEDDKNKPTEPTAEQRGQILVTGVRAFAKELSVEIPEATTSAEGMFNLIRSQFETNRTKAESFDKFRGAAIESAYQAKIRLEGDKMDETKQKSVRTMLEAVSDIETIREFETEWTRGGDERHGNGRQSADDTGKEGDQKEGERDVLPAIFGDVPAEYLQGGV